MFISVYLGVVSSIIVHSSPQSAAGEERILPTWSSHDGRHNSYPFKYMHEYMMISNNEGENLVIERIKKYI